MHIISIEFDPNAFQFWDIKISLMVKLTGQGYVQLLDIFHQEEYFGPIRIPLAISFHFSNQEEIYDSLQANFVFAAIFLLLEFLRGVPSNESAPNKLTFASISPY
jgi:hypothetical protein